MTAATIVAILLSFQGAPAATPAPAQDPAEIRHQADLKRDVESGKKYAEEVLKEYKVSKDKEMADRVQRIGQEMAAIANKNKVQVTWGDPRLNTFEYSFTVLEGDDVNAFSLPGGYIYVFEGLLKFVESDDELAGVLAHEVAHDSLRHIATMDREASKLSILTIPAILIGILAGGEGGGAVLTGVQLGKMALGSGWSVKAEQAADYAGLQYMRASRFNAVGMLTMMERLARKDAIIDSMELGILRTHPPGRERAASLTEHLNEAGIPIRRSEVAPSLAARVKQENGSAVLLFGSSTIATFVGEHSAARAESARIAVNEVFDSLPPLFEVSADPSGAVLGRRQVVIRFTDEDAAAQKRAKLDLARAAVAAMRKAIYSINLSIIRPD